MPYFAFLINEFLRTSANKRLDSIGCEYLFNDILDVLSCYIDKNANCYIIQSNRYSFALKKNSSAISIKAKNIYFSSDIVMALHELGHYLDSRKNGISQLYNLCMLVPINRLLLLPLFVLNFMFYIFFNYNLFNEPFLCYILIIYYFISSYKLIIGSILEWRASKIGLHLLKKQGCSERFADSSKRLLIHCLLNQLLLSVSFFTVIICIVFIQYNIIII